MHIVCAQYSETLGKWLFAAIWQHQFIFDYILTDIWLLVEQTNAYNNVHECQPFQLL